MRRDINLSHWGYTLHSASCHGPPGMKRTTHCRRPRVQRTAVPTLQQRRARRTYTRTCYTHMQYLATKTPTNSFLTARQKEVGKCPRTLLPAGRSQSWCCAVSMPHNDCASVCPRIACHGAVVCVPQPTCAPFAGPSRFCATGASSRHSVIPTHIRGCPPNIACHILGGVEE
jgi:hypothetical protein